MSYSYAQFLSLPLLVAAAVESVTASRALPKTSGRTVAMLAAFALLSHLTALLKRCVDLSQALSCHEHWS